jgi:hypothetical protein
LVCSSAAVPTTLAETIIYKIKIICCSAIIVGTLGYLPALHTNNGKNFTFVAIPNLLKFFEVIG